MNDGEAVLLAVAVASFTPAGRSQNPAAMRLAWRIEQLGAPLPDGFVSITESELYSYHVSQLHPANHVVPSTVGVTMSADEAAELYRTHLSREALR